MIGGEPNVNSSSKSIQIDQIVQGTQILRIRILLGRSDRLMSLTTFTFTMTFESTVDSHSLDPGMDPVEVAKRGGLEQLSDELDEDEFFALFKLVKEEVIKDE